MYDIIVVGAGVAGANFAFKISAHAKTLLVEAQDYKNAIPERTNIFSEHNRPFVAERDWANKTLFPDTHVKTNYMSDDENGIINSKEFGIPLGNICYTENLLKYFIEEFEKQGGLSKFNEKIVKINKYRDHLEVITQKGESYSTRLLVLATGSRGLEIQRSLGFEKPDQYKGICMHLYGDEDLIKDNIDCQYVFHVNPNISTNGPFFINRGVDRIFVGFLGQVRENPSELKSKLDRILQNYKRIQPFVQGLKKGSEVVVGEISKHPINSFSNDRVLLLGECAGLVTSFFYEGIMCGLASAEIAAKTVKPLLTKESNFGKTELIKYDQEIHRILLKNYFRNGNACEYLFYNEGSYVRSLWNTYCNLLNTDKTARKYIWDAYINQDLSNHDINKDRYVGEKLFGTLPALSKITLGAKFFKAMLM